MPHAYGWEHIVYLVLFFAAFIGSLVAIKLKVKKEKTLEIIIKSVGGFLLALIIWNRIAIAFHRGTAWGLVPDSFCGVASLCLAVCVLCFKKDALPFHWVCYIAFYGGLIVTFYPNFLGQNSSFMYPATISGLLHHGVAAYLSVLMVITGYMKPCLKKIYAFPIGLSFMMCWGLFLMDAFGEIVPDFEHAMFIRDPLIPNTYLTWYVMFVVLIAATAGGLFLYEYILKRRAMKKQVTENNEAAD